MNRYFKVVVSISLATDSGTITEHYGYSDVVSYDIFEGDVSSKAKGVVEIGAIVSIYRLMDNKVHKRNHFVGLGEKSASKMSMHVDGEMVLEVAGGACGEL